MSHRSDNRKGVKVSIIIPVYNVAPYIGDCLRSVMRQTYTGCMECIIVDDCSTDDSIAIAEKEIATYKGPIVFKILRHKSNHGLSATRNTGTLAAKGDYIYYLDSDDEITDDCIALLMGMTVEYPEAELVQGNYCIHGLSNDIDIPIKQFPLSIALSNDEVRKCYYRLMNVTFLWNRLIKLDFLIDHHLFNREEIIYEDTQWSFYLLKCLNKACFISTITYHWKIRPHSITTGTERATKAYNYAVVYHDILTNLTPGYEHEELCFYTKKFCNILPKYSRYYLGLKQVFQLCWDLNRKYGSSMLRIRLAACRFLSYFKYGWVFIALIRRVRKPKIILHDFSRIRRHILSTHKKPQGVLHSIEVHKPSTFSEAKDGAYLK